MGRSPNGSKQPHQGGGGRGRVLCIPPSSLQLSLYGKNPLNSDILLNQWQTLLWDTSFSLQKICFHPKCDAGAEIHPAPSPASPTAPGSTENTAICIPHFHKSSEWCCTDRGSSLECKCGQRKVWKREELPLLPSTLYLTEEENRKKDASCFDSCSQFNVSSKVNILS